MTIKGKRILVVGASSDMAFSLNGMLIKGGASVGLHYNKNASALKEYEENSRIKKFQKNLDSSSLCYGLVDEFVAWAGGIDCLIQLSGDILEPVHWEKLSEKHWHYDLNANLLIPFFLAQRAIKHMKDEGGGRIILMSTASASHGGGSTSLAYGVSKAGVECMVKGLARDCAKYNILVNSIAPGFIKTKFHTKRMLRTEAQLEERVNIIPLKRAGTTEEIAGTILFLLSEYSAYITGQVITVSGGDWL